MSHVAAFCICVAQFVRWVAMMAMMIAWILVGGCLATAFFSFVWFFPFIAFAAIYWTIFSPGIGHYLNCGYGIYGNGVFCFQCFCYEHPAITICVILLLLPVYYYSFIKACQIEGSWECAT